jgi:hypothetical protein
MLTENSYKVLADATGMDLQELKDAIQADEEKEITSKYTKYFTDADYEVLYNNVLDKGRSEGHENSKQAGEEMAVKEIKRKYGLEFEGKSAEKLYTFMKQLEEKASSEETSKIRGEYEKDLEALRKQVDEERDKTKKIETQRKLDLINSTIDNEFQGFQIEVPSHIKDADKVKDYARKEIEKNKTYFKSIHQFDLNDSNNIVVKNKNGDILKDDKQSPLPVDILVKKFAEDNFMNIKQQKGGRGEGDYHSGSNELINIQSDDQFNAHLKKKGIHPNSGEADALYIEWKKVKTN